MKGTVHAADLFAGAGGGLQTMSAPRCLDLSGCCQCDSPLYWDGCYTQDARLKPYLDPATIAHPAKMAAGLLSRIFDHLRMLNLLPEGTTVVDFMGGTGRTAIEAVRRGYRAVTVELEPRFVEFQRLNKAATEKALGRTVDWDIRQGDARRLGEILGVGGAGIVSPPYGDSRDYFGQKSPEFWEEMARKTGRKAWTDPESRTRQTITQKDKGYSSNIDNLKAGIVSPPYGMGHGIGHSDGPAWKTRRGEKGISVRYGETPGNIGNLAAIVSPPYERTEGTLHHSKFKDPEKFAINMVARDSSGGPGRHRTSFDARMRQIARSSLGYGAEHPANIASLSGITSPPYMDAQTGGGIAKNGYEGTAGTDNVQNRTYMRETHGATEGQIGAQKPESYWEAMRQVYTEAYRCGISPLVIVTKDPTRNRQIVPLGSSTASLLESCGYSIADYHRAVLFEERRQTTLDGDVKKSVAGRVSFFKRLSIAKGSPAARWEDVLFATKQI
jgi:hypothetical protein